MIDARIIFLEKAAASLAGAKSEAADYSDDLVSEVEVARALRRARALVGAVLAREGEP